MVSIPLADFFDDNSFLFGGNGGLINIVDVIVSNSGADTTFRTDYWSFTEVALDGDGVGDACDGDDDSVDNAVDACSLCDLTPTVVIDGCDSTVPNLQVADGCNVLDEIAVFAAEAGNHGEFVRRVSRLTNDLKKMGLLSGLDKDAIQSCAAEAGIP